MKFLKVIFKFFIYILCIPLGYLIISLILSYITVNDNTVKATTHHIYLNTNGIHLDVIIGKKDLEKSLLQKLKKLDSDKFFAFGWGDKSFYIDTPEMSDIKVSTSLKAMLLNTPAVMHVSRYKSKGEDWVKIAITPQQLQLLVKYIESTFKKNNEQQMILLDIKGYATRDDFYDAKGNYTCIKTCNTWVNYGLKQSGIKSCYWTPFDFVLLNKHRP